MTRAETFPLSLCPTGIVPQRTDSPHVPLSPAEIVDDVLLCAEKGISSVHLHARHPNGDPAWERDIFAEIISGIRAERTDLVICVTTSGRVESDVSKRSDVLALDGDLKPDMASLTLSSMNFAASASINSPQTVQALAETMQQRGIIPELEIFDTGMVNYLHYLRQKNILTPPFVVNLLLGGVASSQATPLDLGFLVERLPEGALWSAAGMGRSQLAANTLALASGGGVRVGLEDNLYHDDDRTTLATNVGLVSRVVEIAKQLERRPMTPTEFRETLRR
jgi:uncharacterized protein (DUF849 family)